MVYYFSGTGNSRYVAQTVANFLNTSHKFIPSTDPLQEKFPNDDIIFVFPIYAWGIPPLVVEFINKLSDIFWRDLSEKNYNVFAIMICGDEVALAPEMFRKTLLQKGVLTKGIWSIVMPNNYVLLPGFDVDSKIVENFKLDNSPGRITEIVKGILQHQQTVDVKRGSIPWIKTKLVYPLFKKWGIITRKWHPTNNCIGCGKCVKICPLNNIYMKNERPKWNAHCCSCLACYHICPYHAVAYGSETNRKGQYFFPLKFKSKS